MVAERLAQRRHRCRPRHNVGARLIANNEVEVTLANAGFFVEFAVKVRKGQERLGRHLPFVDKNRELAALRGDDFTVNKDVVTEVDKVFPALEGFFAHLVERQHRLNALSISRLESSKTEFSRIARVNDSTSEPDLHTGGNVDVEPVVLGTDSTDCCRDRNGYGVCASLGVQPLALRQTNGLLLDNVVGGKFGLVAHTGPFR